MDKGPIQEVWIVENGHRFRAYRGRVQSEVDWKLDHHKEKSPELIVIPEPKEKESS